MLHVRPDLAGFELRREEVAGRDEEERHVELPDRIEDDVEVVPVGSVPDEGPNVGEHDEEHGDCTQTIDAGDALAHPPRFADGFV